jgi:hypothetical protein
VPALQSDCRVGCRLHRGLSPICEPPWHGCAPDHLRGLVNQG